MRVVLLFFLILEFSVPGVQALAPEERTAVIHDLQHGLADSALGRLAPVTAPGTRDSEAQLLMCRLSLQLEHWDAAVSACQRAVALDAGNSTNHVWYGRALGEKADRVSFITAYGLGKRVRSEFETAASLDPRNAEALADLGEYYDEAPAVVGGGKDKAAAVANRLDSVDRARAEELRGHIAESQHDTAAAQQHFREAIAAAAEPANYWMVLASFYRRQNDLDHMEEAIHSGVAADRNKGVPLVDAAHLLTRAGRDPELATRLLREYLASPAQSEEEPAFRVHRFLATLLQKQGDGDGAAREVATASTIASVYHPGKQLATNTGR
jgi:tetratricopeptide (TPR) repeat protein